MLYNEKELRKIVELTDNGIPLSKAKTIVCKPVKKSLDQLERLHSMVLDYFEIKSIKPISRSDADIGAMTIFSYLICHHVFLPQDKPLHERWCQLTGRHRTTYYKIIADYDKGRHLEDNRIVQGKTFTEHFKYLTQ